MQDSPFDCHSEWINKLYDEIAALKLQIKKITKLLDAYKELAKVNKWPVPQEKNDLKI